MSATTKCLMVLTNHGKVEGTDVDTGYYLPEVAHPYYRFKEAGFEVQFASPSGGATTITPASIDLDDAQNKAFYEDAELRAQADNTKACAEFNGSDFDVVFFVGGFGTMWDFPLSADVQRLQQEVYEKGGIVGAVCHGPIALVNTKLSNGEYLVAGKEVAGFTEEEEGMAGMKTHLPVVEGAGQSCEEVLLARGAKFTKADAWACHVASDSRVVTGQNPASAGAVGDAIVSQIQARV